MTFKTVYQIGHLMSMGFLMELKKAAGKPAALKFRITSFPFRHLPEQQPEPAL